MHTDFYIVGFAAKSSFDPIFAPGGTGGSHLDLRVQQLEVARRGLNYQYLRFWYPYIFAIAIELKKNYVRICTVHTVHSKKKVTKNLLLNQKTQIKLKYN